MESYSILPLLFMVYFVVVAAGCAELPYKAENAVRCYFMVLLQELWFCSYC